MCQDRTGTSTLAAATLPGVSTWERVSFTVARFYLRVLLRVLSLSGLYRFGQVFATLEWLINAKRRRRFARVLPDLLGHQLSNAEIRRASLRHAVRVRNDKVFYLIFDYLRPETIERQFTIKNRPFIDDALAMGKGAYLAMSHQGSHHVALVNLLAAGYTIGGVRDTREGAIRRFMQHKFNAKGGKQIRYFHNDVFPRQLYRWFASNALLVSAMDSTRVHRENHKTTSITMFGRARDVLTGPIELAARCGAPALQAFLISRPGFHYEFEVHGPLLDPAKRDHLSEEELQRTLQLYADRIEAFVRKNPCHVSRI